MFNSSVSHTVFTNLTPGVSYTISVFAYIHLLSVMRETTVHYPQVIISIIVPPLQWELSRLPPVTSQPPLILLLLYPHYHPLQYQQVCVCQYNVLLTRTKPQYTAVLLLEVILWEILVSSLQ